jgi:hypothetical protein
MIQSPEADRSIGVVVSCRVQPGQAAAFEDGVRELIRVAARQPGRVAAEVLRGMAGAGGQEYHVVYRFADAAALQAWETSAERRALLARIAPLFQQTGRRALTGMEAWFDLPGGRPPPARWRMALLTWLGIWPLVSLSLWLVAPRLMSAPFLLRTAINSALLVAAMTYIVMPWLARLAAPLLQPPLPASLGSTESLSSAPSTEDQCPSSPPEKASSRISTCSPSHRRSSSSSSIL